MSGEVPWAVLVLIGEFLSAAGVTRPRYELLDWRWVEAEPGASASAVFDLDADRFGYFGIDGTFRIDPGVIVLSVGLDSALLRSVDVAVA